MIPIARWLLPWSQRIAAAEARTRSLVQARTENLMLRQLDQREADGLTVTLEWDSDTGDLLVRCDEHTTYRPRLCCRVDPQDARFAFLHPFALGTLGQIRSLVESGCSGSAHLAGAARPAATGGRRGSRHGEPGASDNGRRLLEERHFAPTHQHDVGADALGRRRKSNRRWSSADRGTACKVAGFTFCAIYVVLVVLALLGGSLSPCRTPIERAPCFAAARIDATERHVARRFVVARTADVGIRTGTGLPCRTRCSRRTGPPTGRPAKD